MRRCVPQQLQLIANASREGRYTLYECAQKQLTGVYDNKWLYVHPQLLPQLGITRAALTLAKNQKYVQHKGLLYFVPTVKPSKLPEIKGTVGAYVQIVPLDIRSDDTTSRALDVTVSELAKE